MAETKGTDARMNFGKKLAELETIAGKLESGELDLEAGIDQYEKGMKLVQELRTYLDSATNRVEEVRKKYQDQSDDVVAPTPADDLPF